MFQAIYYEESLRQHPFVTAFLERHSKLPQIACERYGEVFNPNQQSFRIQKQYPSIILAEKKQGHVLPTPEGYGIGYMHNYYFSHMLNCVFDCRYCFLQGMYNSAHYVVFVNLEDFESEIEAKALEHAGESVCFFSGYDCDSLALESVTHFIERILPLFRAHENAHLELRTKSTNIRFLTESDPIPNVVVAFTLTPKRVASLLENKTPPIFKRLQALKELQDLGWTIGLRFDPLIHYQHFREDYEELFQQVFAMLDPERIHSATMGPFRMPKGVYKKILGCYPDEPLFATGLNEQAKTVSYREDREQELLEFCEQEILKYIPENVYFPCEVPAT